MFERSHSPLLPKRAFFKRLAFNIFLGTLLIALALLIGMAGYHYFEQQAWIDAFVSAAMILSGMGPTSELKTHAGKLFAGFYALFSGLSFILIVGLILAPVMHRFFHQFHVQTEEDEEKAESKEKGQGNKSSRKQKPQ